MTDIDKLAAEMRAKLAEVRISTGQYGRVLGLMERAVDALEEQARTIESLRSISNVNGDWSLKYQDALTRAEKAEARITEALEVLREPYPGSPIPSGSRLGPYDWVTAAADARRILGGEL